ncbi:MAG: hypothetical protein WKG32_18880 [Gemmatimonadaceae bacterium]
MLKRLWGDMDFLRSVLEPKRREFENSQYLSSIDDTNLDWLRRLLSLAALVAASRNDLLAAIRGGESVTEREERARAAALELLELRERLRLGEHIVAKAARDVAGVLDMMRATSYEEAEASAKPPEREGR